MMGVGGPGKMMPMIFNDVDVNSRLSHRGKYPDVRGRVSHSVQQCLSSLAVQKLSCPFNAGKCQMFCQSEKNVCRNHSELADGIR